MFVVFSVNIIVRKKDKALLKNGNTVKPLFIMLFSKEGMKIMKRIIYLLVCWKRRENKEYK